MHVMDLVVVVRSTMICALARLNKMMKNMSRTDASKGVAGNVPYVFLNTQLA